MTTIKPRFAENDHLDARRINAFIRDATATLSEIPFDPATGGLPLRSDVHFWSTWYLASEDEPVLRASGIDPPYVSLKSDGTLAIRFVCRFRSLTFHVLCRHVVRQTRTFDDGATVIDGYLPGEHAADLEAVTGLLAWLGDPGEEDEA